jgi:hypothetical protein
MATAAERVREANQRLENAARAARKDMTDRQRIDALERMCEANRADIRRLEERCDELQRQLVK